jgi:hypothetical protein
MKYKFRVFCFISSFLFLQTLVFAQSFISNVHSSPENGRSTVEMSDFKSSPDSTDTIKPIGKDTVETKTSSIQKSGKDSLKKESTLEKIKKNKYGQLFPTKVQEIEINNSSLSLSLGLGIPTSKFTETGYMSAKTGIAFSFNWASRGYIGVLCNVTYAHNGAEIDDFNGSVSSGWNTFWLLGGMKFGTKNPDGDNYYVGPLIGLCTISYPELSSEVLISGSGSTATYRTVKSKDENASALGIGGIISGNIGHVQIGLMYVLAYRKHYTTSITSYSDYAYTESWTSDYRAEIRMCEISIGYHF